MKLKYEYLDIELDITYAEAEKILWNYVSMGAPMPFVEEMLDYLKVNKIRSGVISNICWSGNALTERINRLLPNNQFEFIIPSSEYIIRKPNPMIFELALQKAKLQASDVWYCGDNVKADIYGARNAGIYPVFYEDLTIDSPWVEYNDSSQIEFDYLHIHNWKEMIPILTGLER